MVATLRKSSLFTGESLNANHKDVNRLPAWQPILVPPVLKGPMNYLQTT